MQLGCQPTPDEPLTGQGEAGSGFSGESEVVMWSGLRLALGPEHQMDWVPCGKGRLCYQKEPVWSRSRALWDKEQLRLSSLATEGKRSRCAEGITMQAGWGGDSVFNLYPSSSLTWWAMGG